ncbi:AraC family transcriptional regulator ligand-binding domain-containing protein [Rhodobacter capsulatus]|uniref:AraC family transcriptional regulator ligand-binding domain-containing protein n=1 Tax=Rhodobacter capsulatus TaxID=1061 RepID=UPI004038547B
MKTLLAREQLSPEVLADPYEAIPLQSYLSIFEAAAELAGDPLFGARLGFGMRPGNLAPIGLRAVQAGTIRGALTAFARWSGALQSATQSSLTEEEDQLVFTYRLTAPVLIASRQDTEFSLAAVSRLIRGAFDPRWRPLEIRFTHPPIAEKPRLEALFRARCAIPSPSMPSSFPPPRPTGASRRGPGHDRADRAASAGSDRRCGPRRKPGHQVEALIELYLGVRPIDLPTIAAALRMAPRSLQRRLAEEGQSLSGLLRRQRQRRAEVLLRERGLSVEAVAQALGYADGTVFWRAWRSWTGEAPSRPAPN